jgi:hypothetical protein
MEMSIIVLVICYHSLLFEFSLMCLPSALETPDDTNHGQSDTSHTSDCTSRDCTNVISCG